MGKELFGTDGIRGVAGEYPLDPATVFAFGVALGHDADGGAGKPGSADRHGHARIRRRGSPNWWPAAWRAAGRASALRA